MGLLHWPLDARSAPNARAAVPHFKPRLATGASHGPVRHHHPQHSVWLVGVHREDAAHESSHVLVHFPHRPQSRYAIDGMESVLDVHLDHHVLLVVLHVKVHPVRQHPLPIPHPDAVLRRSKLFCPVLCESQRSCFGRNPPRNLRDAHRPALAFFFHHHQPPPPPQPHHRSRDVPPEHPLGPEASVRLVVARAVPRHCTKVLDPPPALPRRPSRLLKPQGLVQVIRRIHLVFFPVPRPSDLANPLRRRPPRMIVLPPRSPPLPLPHPRREQPLCRLERLVGVRRRPPLARALNCLGELPLGRQPRHRFPLRIACDLFTALPAPPPRPLPQNFLDKLVRNFGCILSTSPPPPWTPPAAPLLNNLTFCFSPFPPRPKAVHDRCSGFPLHLFLAVAHRKIAVALPLPPPFFIPRSLLRPAAPPPTPIPPSPVIIVRLIVLAHGIRRTLLLVRRRVRHNAVVAVAGSAPLSTRRPLRFPNPDASTLRMIDLRLCRLDTMHLRLYRHNNIIVLRFYLHTIILRSYRNATPITVRFARSGRRFHVVVAFAAVIIIAFRPSPSRRGR